MKIKLFNLLAPVAFLALSGLSACQEDKDEDLNLARMFMPTGAIQSVGSATTVKLSWQEALFADAQQANYTVEVATDTLFTTPVVLSVTTDTTGVTLTDEKLNVRQVYYARVKTNAMANTPESKWVVSSRFLIPGEQIFTRTRVIDRAAAFEWRETAGLTKIVLTPEAGTPLEVPVTADDIAAKGKTVGNLTAATSYTAEVFAGTKSKGFLNFRTEAPLSGNLVDLRGITGKASALADTILDVPAGSTIILKRGETYNISAAIALNKAVTILSGPDLNDPSQATIFFTSNFNFAAGSVIDYIDFKEVNFRGNAYGSNYVFNTTGAATVGRISFESCRAEVFRGLARIQSGATTIDNFVVNNSVLDSLSNYGVLTVDNAACKVNNIAIKNSTIYKAEKVITSRQNSVSLVLENCTVNEAPLGGDTNYLIDYSTAATNTVSQGITITNCIMGIAKSGIANNRVVKGIRTNAATPISVTNTYKTSDYVSNTNLIPSLISYNGTSFDLFQSPKAGDFKIKDTGFAGKSTAGDPRWRF
jgi:Domain of unknown function (DUF5123)/Domain of unknown function (DUF4957)/SusE outer membrane protein